MTYHHLTLKTLEYKNKSLQKNSNENLSFGQIIKILLKKKFFLILLNTPAPLQNSPINVSIALKAN